MSMRLWYVRGQVRGLNLERLFNEAGKRGIRLLRVEREKNRAAVVRCAPGDYRALRALAAEKGYEMDAGQPAGLLRALHRLGARRGLLLGLMLGAALTAASLRFVWRVEIRQAGAYEADARLCLEEMGIRPGIPRSRVDLSALREKLEWRWPRVQWVRAEWAGVALRITLEEGTPPPDVETEGKCGDVVAAEDGLLLRLTVYAGTPQAREGDLIRAGQVLIRGEERGAAGDAVAVKARGEAVARVWVTARARLPLWEYFSRPTGRRAQRRVIEAPFFSFSLQEAPAYLTWDLEEEWMPLCGAWLPVQLRRQTYLEAAVETSRRDEEDVKAEAARAALRLLNEAVRGDETVDKWINFRMIEEDTIVAEATAEVRRDVGRFQPR